MNFKIIPLPADHDDEDALNKWNSFQEKKKRPRQIQILQSKIATKRIPRFSNIVNMISFSEFEFTRRVLPGPVVLETLLELHEQVLDDKKQQEMLYPRKIFFPMEISHHNSPP